MPLKSLASLGRIEKEFEISAEFKVKLHTLNSRENQKVLLEAPTQGDAVARYTYLQLVTLMYATDELNGEKISDANRAELREVYGNLQNKILDVLFDKYLELITEQDAIVEELKKK